MEDSNEQFTYYLTKKQKKELHWVAYKTRSKDAITLPTQWRSSIEILEASMLVLISSLVMVMLLQMLSG